MTKERFVDVFIAACDDEMDEIIREIDEGTIDIDFNYLGRLAYDILMEVDIDAHQKQS